ncbi:MAG: PQQ-binding-like beta-propeller repeat protein [Polyangiaceae bacterium]|nr:PQQ-binding-like beta-propeller repeat protein [Polyangiaceae bacterium]
MTRSTATRRTATRRTVTRGARLGAATLAVAALGLAGCDALRAGASPELPLWKYRPSGSLSVVYKKQIVAEMRKVGEPYERGQPEIDAKNRRLFVGSSDRGLYAIRAVTGEVLWRFETLGFVQCAPLYDAGEDVVYFGSNDGALYKVKAATGELIWRFSTNAEVARRPVLERGVVYAVNANDTVVALESKTGKLIWSQHRTPALGMEVAGYSGPLVWRGKLFVGFSDGTVTAFDAKRGDEVWQPVDLAAEAEQRQGELPTYLDVDTTPVADTIEAGAVVYVGSYAGGVWALDADSGTPVWSNPAVEGVSELTLWTEPAHPPRDGKGPTVPEKKLLLAATGTTGLWALDPETGRDEWRRSLPDGGISAPVPVRGALLVNTSKLGVFLLSPVDGSVIDGIHMVDGSAHTPAAYGNRAFVVSNHGDLLSLHVAGPAGR